MRTSFVRHRIGALVVVGCLAAIGVAMLVGLSGTGPHDAQPPAQAAASVDEAVGVPRPVEPAFTPGPATFLSPSNDLSRWAVIRRPVLVRTGPSSRASTLTLLEKQTPEGTTNIVLVIGGRPDEHGRLWIHVRVPVLGERNTGWVPRLALGGYGTVTTRLIVDLSSLQATLFRHGRRVFRADVGVGKSAWPTPRGEFYVRNKLTDFASPMYGPVAFGTSARSAVLTDWPAGGYVGIHGTDEPELLPGHVSHGCIRMRNADILRLSKLMPVGTPITIR